MFTDLSVAMMNNLLWMPWPCCYLVWLLVACSRSSRATLSPDGLALLEFKTHITYDADGRLNDWKASDDTPCAWTGVTCVPSGNASVVSELNLPLATMEGSLSASLGSLANLTALDLRWNRLSGAMPNEIVNCKLLTSLDLSYNLLNGSIPALGALTNLTFLDLSGNDLSGDIGTLGLANALKWLGLEGNQFAGTLPNMSGRKDLMYLSFNGKLTGGKIPDLSASREVLWELRMRGAQLEGPLPTWIANLPSLLTLDLSSNNLSGQIQRVGDPGQTSGLELQGIQLSGACAATCPSWSVLYFLDLSHNSGVNLVNSSLELMLTSFSQLAELHLSNIGSSGRLVRPRAGAPTARTFDSPLKVLDLSVSNLEGDQFHSIFADAHLLFRHLESLNLSGNRLTGQVPPGLAVLPNLRALDLSNNRLSGPLPAFLPHLQNATFFAGNSELCGFPLKPCKPPSPKSLVLPLALALVACLLLFAASCVFFAWRLRKYNLRHQQDAQLIAVMQGKNRANLMPLAELRKATSNFSQESQIGVGGFGTVHKGRLNDGTTVAIKRSNREEGSQEDKEQFLNEVNILSLVNHRNLVRLLGCCLENKVALLVFEYVPSGTLQENLRQPRVPLTWEQRVRIA